MNVCGASWQPVKPRYWATGGVSLVRRACGLSRKAIRKGIREIESGGADPTRKRQSYSFLCMQNAGSRWNLICIFRPSKRRRYHEFVIR